MSLNDKDNAFLAEIEAVADGKIVCPCGNSDWRQFLYVGGAGSNHHAAGCKHCGTMFVHTGGGNWRETMKGPKRK